MEAVIKVDARVRTGMALLVHLPNYLLTRKSRQRNNGTWVTFLIWIIQLSSVSDDLYNKELAPILLLLYDDIYDVLAKPGLFRQLAKIQGSFIGLIT